MEFTITWPIITDGCDSEGRVTLPYLFSLMQETATLHANTLNCGYDDMEEKGFYWVLSRQWLKMKSFPLWQDDLTISTWPSGKTALTWLRDFRFTDSQGTVVGEGTSLWFVMDRETRRPKPAHLGLEMDVLDAPRVREDDLKALPPLERPSKLSEVIAGHFDVDVHKHVNNVRYLQWMLDALPHRFQTDCLPHEVEVNYLAEGFEEDHYDVLLTGGGLNFDHCLKRHSDGREMARMRSIWTPVES